MLTVNDLIAECAAVSLVLFVGLALCVPLALAMVGTVEGKELRPLEAAVTWMRRHRAQHRRSSRRLRAQWDVQLAHSGGRYEELPTVAEYDTDTLRLFHDMATDIAYDSVVDGCCIRCQRIDPAEPCAGCYCHDDYSDRSASPQEVPEVARTSIFDRLSDTDCFAAINWDIHRAVNELAVLQRDLWAGYKLPPWKGRKR